MRKIARRSLLCAGAVLLCVGAYLLFGNAADEQAPVTLFAKDGYTLRTGASFEKAARVTFTRQELLSGLLVYVSAEHPLPADMPPPNTRALTRMLGQYVRADDRVSLAQEAIYALCALATEYPLYEAALTWGARSPMQQTAEQKATFERYCSVMPVKDALTQATRDVPDAGLSEHQTAYAFDLALAGVQNLGERDPLARTSEGRAWRDNAWRYGFVRRYPPEKASVTGVHNEDTHFRYVGETNAAILHVSDWCLEEYLRSLHEHGALTLYQNETPLAYVLCAKGDAEAAFDVPEHAALEVSCDNLGYAVLVIVISE